MGATPLNKIHLPDHAVAEIAEADIDERITNHTVTVKPRWWTERLANPQLNDTPVGEKISRGEIFALAAAATSHPEDALTCCGTPSRGAAGNATEITPSGLPRWRRTPQMRPSCS